MVQVAFLPLWRLVIILWPLFLLVTVPLVCQFIYTSISYAIHASTCNRQLLGWAALAAFMASIIAHFIRKNIRLRRALAKLPGHCGIGILANTLMLLEAMLNIGHASLSVVQVTHAGRMLLQDNEKFKETNGLPEIAIIYLGPKMILSIFTPETAEGILSSNDLIRKSDTYNLLHPWLGTGLLTSWGRKWHSNRKMLTPAFHFTILESFVPVMARNAKSLVDHLESEMKKNQDGLVNDLSRPILLCALDVICETAMGRRINAQDDPEANYVKSVHQMGESFMNRLFQPWTWNEKLYSFTTHGRKIRETLHVLHRFTDQVIEERKEEIIFESNDDVIPINKTHYSSGNASLLESLKKKREPFMDTLIQEHLARPKDFSMFNVREEVDTFMFEGHDTTAWGSIWSIYLLGLHPDVQERVHEEVDALFEDVPINAEVSLEDLKSKLPYTEAVIKEAQRLYPSVPIIMRSVDQDVPIGGYIVPAGVEVAIHVYCVHRDPRHWPEPERFIPDRFLEKRGRHPYAYIPFSAGPRNCIGQKFALLEEKAILAHVLRRFKITSLDHRDKVLPTASLISKASIPIRVKLDIRK